MGDTLYSLLERSAADHADDPAIFFRGRRVSYAELLEASDRLAGFLAEHGVGHGSHVAFSFLKSVEALVSLFASIRVGATYVPLDPAWPQERVAAICRDAEIETWLGSRPPNVPGIRLAIAAAPGPSAARVIPIAEARRHPPLTSDAVEPWDGIANVLYTSGSTGKPKGVLITTESLLWFSEWAVKTFGIQASDRVANHAPYHFDLSTLDIFAAVRAGAAMCPVPEQTRLLPYPMASFIADEQISVWYSAPSALVAMQEQLRRQAFPRVRCVLFAGEVMPKPALKALAEALPRAALANLFGPTETNVCTFHRVTPKDLETDDDLPIGRPIDRTRVWIVDEEGRAVDDGARGELVVAGPTVTPGYLGDPELTARRLTAAPDGSGLAYRTSDCVSRREDGLLMFHGRMDRMIKIRGYRIEPGEIEAALCRHPHVVEAAVLTMLDDERGGPCIRACVALSPGAEQSVAALAAHCRSLLPSYMVPEVWSFYARLPRTDRGKADLQALAQAAP